jgi:VanZ family protein
MTITGFSRLVAWATLAFIIFSTVAPIDWRPHDLLPVNVDRAAAFMLATLLFILAYPRHFVLCSALLIFGAGAIEILQYLSPTRHPQFEDATVKALGAAAGAILGWTINQVRFFRTKRLKAEARQEAS